MQFSAAASAAPPLVRSEPLEPGGEVVERLVERRADRALHRGQPGVRLGEPGVPAALAFLGLDLQLPQWEVRGDTPLY